MKPKFLRWGVYVIDVFCDAKSFLVSLNYKIEPSQEGYVVTTLDPSKAQMFRDPDEAAQFVDRHLRDYRHARVAHVIAELTVQYPLLSYSWLDPPEAWMSPAMAHYIAYRDGQYLHWKEKLRDDLRKSSCGLEDFFEELLNEAIEAARTPERGTI